MLVFLIKKKNHSKTILHFTLSPSFETNPGPLHWISKMMKSKEAKLNGLCSLCDVGYPYLCRSHLMLDFRIEIINEINRALVAYVVSSPV